MRQRCVRCGTWTTTPLCQRCWRAQQDEQTPPAANVRDYGAVGDDHTDDAPAAQRAVRSAT